jgi:hypothetical protein
MPEIDGQEPKPRDSDNEASDRRAANIFLAVAGIILIGAGV